MGCELAMGNDPVATQNEREKGLETGPCESDDDEVSGCVATDEESEP
ncbi:unnamed protein product [Heligmosomoides polygyrus]|uniref:Uncharacterized protein n=1 Tax=Heligmosomoides polygyrus TaxID=6339 RepID=A0A183FC46_HELPZ|nr:unnamed protein product [Heligmosomoides polygyrus]